MAKTFDPWTATDSEALAATLRMGFDPMAVALVTGRDSRLVYLLPTLPPMAPLRRWCAAGQVLKLLDDGASSASLAQVLHALELCHSHELEVPAWLRRCLMLRRRAHDVMAQPVEPDDEDRRKARQRRQVWEIRRRFAWAHPGVAAKVLWSALAAGPMLGKGLERGLSVAVRRLGMGSTTARARLNEAERLYGRPTWPAKVAPPLTTWRN